MIKPILILLFAMLSIQYAASQAKQLFPILGVAGTSTFRLLFAAIMMSAIFRPWKIRFGKSTWLYGVALGLMNFAFYFALQRIPLGIAVALEFVGPLAVAIYNSKRKIDFLWVILAAVGILLLVPTEGSMTTLDPVGIFLALLAGLFWALYIIFGKRSGTEHQGGVAASAGMVIAALVVLPFGVMIDGPKLLNLSALPLALMVAFFGSALPYSLEMMALRKLPAGTFGVLMSLEPMVASVIGLIFLGEILTPKHIAAIGCVIISSLGTTLTQRRP
jgi:inner membrane transporter RhtA